MDRLNNDGIASVTFAAAAISEEVDQSVDVALLFVVEGAGFVDQAVEAFAVASVVGGQVCDDLLGCPIHGAFVAVGEQATA